MHAHAPPEEAITGANSPDWSTRAAAGQRLAAWAHLDAIADILRRLLLDRGNTAVVEATCLALLRRNDIHGARLVAQAIPAAEDLMNIRLDHLYHLHDTVVNYLMPDWLGQVDGIVDGFLILCDALAQDPDPTTVAGARELAGWARP